MEHWLRLLPGDAMVFDNQRVFHGRSGFDTRSERVLSGCYVQDDEYRSAMRVCARRLARELTPASERLSLGETEDGVVLTLDDLDPGFAVAE